MLIASAKTLELEGKHLAIQFLMASARLLVQLCRWILLVPGVAEGNKEAEWI